MRGKASLDFIELVYPSSEKGKPTERWGHKADGSTIRDGRVAGEREQQVEEDVMKLKFLFTHVVSNFCDRPWQYGLCFPFRRRRRLRRLPLHA